jgi:murein DD-endopeptidase MepM/ murein hydrolase activator NlpD
MNKRILCVIIASVLLSLVRPTQTHAFSFILFQEAHASEKSTIAPQAIPTDLPEVTLISNKESDTLDSTPSAQIDAAFLLVDPVPHNASDSANVASVLPIAPDLVKGVSTYFSGYHPGIDIRAEVGSPILSLRDGIVVESSFQPGGYGRYVIVEHQIGSLSVRSLYAHMKESKAKIGDKVQARDVIGYVGLTGHTTGAHLHLETRVCDPALQYYVCRAMDPIRFITKGVPPILVASTKK